MPWSYVAELRSLVQGTPTRFTWIHLQKTCNQGLVSSIYALRVARKDLLVHVGHLLGYDECHLKNKYGG